MIVLIEKRASNSLRLRSKKITNGSISTSMNVKIITTEGDYTEWSELEIVVSSFEEAMKCC